MERRGTPVLVIVLASYLMIVLDISIVITALPKIQDGLGFSTAELSWVQNAYTLAFGGLLLLGARAGDILGRRRMFVAGIALFTVASLGVGLAQSTGWLIAMRALQGTGAAILAPSTLALLSTTLLAGVVLLALFVVNERGAKQPIMPLRLFASRERAAACAGRVLFLGAMLGFWFFLTQYLQSVRGDSPLEAGIAFLPMTIVNFAVAMAVPRLTRRIGNARLLAGGIAITLVGMAWLSRLSVDTSYLTGIALPMAVIGAGQGASLSPLTTAGIAGVAAEDAGAASGLVNVAHQLGGSLGLGILVTVFAAAGGGVAHRVGFALTAGTGMLALALVLVLALIVRPGVPRRAVVVPRAA